MKILKRKKYWWEDDEDDKENELENPVDLTVRQELEKQFQNPMHNQLYEANPFANLDTSNMNLREELEAKFNTLNDDEIDGFENQHGNFSQDVNYDLYGQGFDKKFIDEMLQNKTYQRALTEYAIPNEGGYVNLTNDPGKETNMGISKRYYPNEDIKNLTRERANAILYKDFWNWNGINKLPPEVVGFVFDYGIRTSPQNAIETTHQALEIDPVGDIIGNTTLSKLNDMDLEEFLRRYRELIKRKDQRRSGYKHFGRGWNNRTNGYHLSR